MNYSLGYTLGRTSVFSRGDADANAYIAAVEAAGATVTPTQRNAIDDFYVSAKADSYYTSLKRLYLPIWGIAAANAIDMIGLTSGTFNGGVTHGAGFVQGNGSTGYFNMGTSIGGVGMTLASQYISILNYTAPSAALTVLLGTGSSFTSDIYRINADVNFRYGGGSTQVTGTATARGILSGSKTSGNSSLYRRTTSGKTTLASSSVADASSISTANFFAMAANQNDVSGSNPVFLSDSQVGSYSIGLGLSDAQDTAFSLALKNLWETATGLTLP